MRRSWLVLVPGSRPAQGTARVRSALLRRHPIGREDGRGSRHILDPDVDRVRAVELAVIERRVRGQVLDGVRAVVVIELDLGALWDVDVVHDNLDPSTGL